MDISKILNGTKLDSLSTQPLYLQISQLIASKILDQTLAPDSKLPPERELAALFGVSRTTAINAYRQLEQQGLVRTRVGSGTYVSGGTGQANTPSPGIPWSQLFTPYPQTPSSSILRELVSTPISSDVISLAAGMPDPSFYPLAALKALLNEHLDQVERGAFGHIPTEGYPPLRESLAALLHDKGIKSTADNILVVSGSQQGLYLTSRVLLEPGDYVIVESPTYIGAIQTFQSIGARILTLPASGTFPLDIFEDYLIRYRPKMFYIIPTFQNPTGRVLPEKERWEALTLAARHRLVIVEDDPYSQLYYRTEPPPTLKALDPYHGVVYMSTFSKILAPGLRMGYVCAPPALINRLALEKQYIDLHSNNLSQWLLHLFLQQVNLEDHLAFLRTEYKKRRDALVRAIRRSCGDDLVFAVPDGGFYLWCKIQAPVTAGKLLHEATKNGIFFVPGEAFYATAGGYKEFRLCFATHEETLLAEGAHRLAQSLRQLAKSKRGQGLGDKYRLNNQGSILP
jgi:DNA-binding transcriptional MocR family regulator